jgi:hypothetical protein
VPPWCRRNPDGSVDLFLHVQPGAKRTEVAGLHGDALRIRIAAPALEDRANEALVAFIASRLGIAKRDVVIAGGERSREKRVRVTAPIADVETLAD